MKIQDTLDNKQKLLELDISKVLKIYVCGITPYSESHIGHAMSAVIFDTLRRYLISQNYKMNFVQNFTDIDDKLIIAAKENNTTIDKISNKYITQHVNSLSKLNVLAADHAPKATEEIKEMINMINVLISKEMAYEINGDCYFRVNKFETYGKLSKRNIEEMLAGARIDINENKEHPMDFALWKKQISDEPGWESPWGIGRPGWHIECSAMSMKYLGQNLDIHGGGRDLIFPHHENEIAQTCAAHKSNDDLKSFSKYWFHNGFVNVEGEKMSKSIGNIKLVHDLVKEYKGEVLRLTLLSAHYRQPLNWTRDIIKQNSTMLDRLYRTLKDLEKIDAYAEKNEIEERIINGLYDDLNTPKVIAELNMLTNGINNADVKTKQKIKFNLLEIGKIFGILQENPDTWLGYGQSKNINQDTIERLIKERNEARRNKNFDMADEIRKKLKEEGVEIEDTSEGTIWRSI